MDLRRAQEAMDLELSFDEGERIGGRGSIVGPIVGYGGKPMESLEEQSHCIGNSSASIDKCAQPTCGSTGDGEGGYFSSRWSCCWARDI